MSYHYTSTSARQSAANRQSRIAPAGYHYMPNGALMLDSDMQEYTRSEESLLNDILITGFEMDLSPIVAAGESRSFTITGDIGAIFELVIKNEDAYYYNFYTKVFQVEKSFLRKTIISKAAFVGSVQFPVVTDDDQYDISITAVGETKHYNYNEVRFADGSLDINLSTGSNSLLITKVIYQYVDLVLTITALSPTSAITSTIVADTIAVSSGVGLTQQIEFETTVTVANDKALQIIKQPTHLDMLAFVSPVIGAAPINIPGENIYPAISDTDTVNGIIAGGGSVIKVVMDNNVATNLVVGDKITAATSTSTVNGAVSSGVNVNMDHTVTTIMAVGDQVTAPTFESPINSKLVTVAALSVGGDTGVFALSEAIALSDGMALIFSPKCNRSLTTVAALNPDTDNVKEFSMSQNIGLVDGVTLSFSNQMNYRWPITNFAHKLAADNIIVPTTNLTANSVLADYQDTTTVFTGTEQERILINYEAPAVSTLFLTPVVAKGEITTQAGAITFDRQQVLALAGDTLKAGGYGQDEIFNTLGYDLVFNDLQVSLTQVSTTTTAAVINSTTVPVTSRNGILDDVSTVSGIGINSTVADPTVDTGAGAVTGAGALVLTAAQNIENGATLTFANAGLVATITGTVEVIRAGTASVSVFIDIEKLLSIT